MKIIRVPLYGGEVYYCDHCGTVVEQNFYPTNEVGSSAWAKWIADAEKAKEEGIFFSGYSPCNCEEYEEHEQ